MSCNACDDRQNDGAICYYRWKNANLLIVGCDEHLKEVFEALNEVQAAREKASRDIKDGTKR